MSVHPGQAEEYARRHQPIWPELEKMLLAHGVCAYTIFIDPATSDLFAYVEYESEEQWAAIAETAVCQRWWAHMSGLMPSRADNSPVATVLDEVFHIENEDGRHGSTSSREGVSVRSTSKETP
jgi:L-rhamnose mutarotase